MQKGATKIPSACKHLSYRDRLKACNITNLHRRHISGDLIETCKIAMGKYEEDVAPVLAKVCNYVTRGNDFRVEKTRSKYDFENLDSQLG